MRIAGARDDILAILNNKAGAMIAFCVQGVILPLASTVEDAVPKGSSHML